MRSYLDAHAAFVNWLDGAADCDPTAAQVEEAMFDLAAHAARRGMNREHWRFVVDGLIAHAKRRCPDNADLPDFVARAFDFSTRWSSVEAAANRPG